MKCILYPSLLLAIFIFCSQFCFAQKDTTYFDAKWHPTDRANAQYYRFINKEDDSNYTIQDFYLSGTLQMEGKYNSLDTPGNPHRNGIFKYYFPSGHVRSIGYYEHGLRTGQWAIYYNSNNALKAQVTYVDDSLSGEASYYDSIGHRLTSTGRFFDGRRTGEWKYFNRNGKVYLTENYRNKGTEATATIMDAEGKITLKGETSHGKRTGIWKYYENEKLVGTKNYVNDVLDGESIEYFPSAKIKRKELYSFGKLSSGKAYNEEGNEVPYTPAAQMPEPAFNLSEYLKEHLKYPSKARRNNIVGRVKVQFVVDEEGNIINAKVIEGIGGGCDKEALRVVKQMPKWKPGTLDGKPVKIIYTLPIHFYLTDNKQPAN
ncbi:MAG: TonB family protein [Bacteroidetes bacterium]|nr:TonB family protein [Bacteroidota bacterium]